MIQGIRCITYNVNRERKRERKRERERERERDTKGSWVYQHTSCI